MSATETRLRGSAHSAEVEVDDEVVHAPREDRTAGSEGAGRLIGLGELASAREDRPVGPTGPNRAGLLTWTIAAAIVAVIVMLALWIMGSIYSPKPPRSLHVTSANAIVISVRPAG